MGETSRGADTSQAGRGHGGSITAPLAGRRAVPAGTGRVGGVRLDATSPLALASHLVGLARDADRTGLSALAEQLLALACAVLDDPPAAFV